MNFVEKLCIVSLDYIVEHVIYLLAYLPIN